MLPYQYEALHHDDSIRILIIRPSSNEADTVTCTIRHARLSDTLLEYEALSYTWGDVTHKQEIHIRKHGQPESRRELLVGRNCHSALYHLRHGSRDRSFWIDAICINQVDLEERSKQVRMMDRIYRFAWNVTVYLGESTPGSRLFIKPRTPALHSPILGSTRPSKDVLAQGLVELLRRPWFERVWVIQEVSRAAKVTFMCGYDKASFETFDELIIEQVHANDLFSLFKYPLPLSLLVRAPEEFLSPQFSLLHWLYQSRDCLATDNRDRVFALKTLIGSTQSHVDFLIDYTQEFEKSFTQVAQFLLPVLGLRILVAIRHAHNRNMPSWVPDWSQNTPLESFFFYQDSLDRASNDPAMPRLRRSSEQKHVVRPYTDRDGNVLLELHCTGCQYAQIVESSEAFLFDNIADGELQMDEFCIDKEGTWDFAAASQRFPQRILDGRYMVIIPRQAVADQIAMSLIDGRQLYTHFFRDHPIKVYYYHSINAHD
jgi:hypothetical protein